MTPEHQPSPKFVYKVLTKEQWSSCELGPFSHECGSDLDRRDGYLHVSMAHQVEPVAKKYFSDLEDGFLIMLEYELIKTLVKFEPNSKQELFPHIYGVIPKKAIVEVMPFDVNTFDFEILQD